MSFLSPSFLRRCWPLGSPLLGLLTIDVDTDNRAAGELNDLCTTLRVEPLITRLGNPISHGLP